VLYQKVAAINYSRAPAAPQKKKQIVGQCLQLYLSSWWECMWGHGNMYPELVISESWWEEHLPGYIVKGATR